MVDSPGELPVVLVTPAVPDAAFARQVPNYLFQTCAYMRQPVPEFFQEIPRGSLEHSRYVAHALRLFFRQYEDDRPHDRFAVTYHAPL